MTNEELMQALNTVLANFNRNVTGGLDSSAAGLYQAGKGLAQGDTGVVDRFNQGRNQYWNQQQAAIDARPDVNANMNAAMLGVGAAAAPQLMRGAVQGARSYMPQPTPGQPGVVDRGPATTGMSVGELSAADYQNAVNNARAKAAGQRGGAQPAVPTQGIDVRNITPQEYNQYLPTGEKLPIPRQNMTQSDPFLANIGRQAEAERLDSTKTFLTDEQKRAQMKKVIDEIKAKMSKQ